MGVLGELGQEGRRLLLRHKLHYAVLVTGVVVVGAAALMLAVEEGGEGSIDTFGDALWWAITTVTTVGYGDSFPTTDIGRVIGMCVMLVGIGFVAILTGAVAQRFLAPSVEEVEETEEAIELTEEELVRQVREMSTQLAALERALARRFAGQ